MVQDVLFETLWSIFGLVFLVVGLHTARNGWNDRAQSKRIAATETTAIRDIQPGAVEIKGTARPAEDATVFESPIQRADALAAHVEVEEWESSGQGDRKSVV